MGGYGRNELFPGSDIDLSIIQFAKSTNKLEEVSNFIAWLWTLNVKSNYCFKYVFYYKPQEIDMVTISYGS